MRSLGLKEQRAAQLYSFLSNNAYKSVRFFEFVLKREKP